MKRGVEEHACDRWSSAKPIWRNRYSFLELNHCEKLSNFHIAQNAAACNEGDCSLPRGPFLSLENGLFCACDDRANKWKWICFCDSGNELQREYLYSTCGVPSFLVPGRLSFSPLTFSHPWFIKSLCLWGSLWTSKLLSATNGDYLLVRKKPPTFRCVENSQTPS